MGKFATWFKTLPIYGKIAVGALLIIVFGGSYLGFWPKPPLDLPIEFQAKAPSGEVYATGWVDDPVAVQVVAGKLATPSFAATPAGQIDADTLPKDVYQWQAEKIITGKNPPVKNQKSVGSCVSFGTDNAIERTMAIQIVIKQQPEELYRLVEEITYAGARVEIGGGRIRGDGAVGADAAQFAKEYGVVRRAKYDSVDLTEYSESRCRSWGYSGVPQEFETIAREHPVKDVTKILTWNSAKKALAQGYGIAICSNVGYAGMVRDANGVINPSGTWNHCMCLDGYHTEPDGTEYGHIENQWGERAHTGPVGWGNPSVAGFWTKAENIERMLKQGDSWAFASLSGFPAQKIDWFIFQEKIWAKDILKEMKRCEITEWDLLPHFASRF